MTKTPEPKSQHATEATSSASRATPPGAAAAAAANTPPGGGGGGGGVAIRWNTTKLASSYANFCNANSTREEVVLNFGVNQSWERAGPEGSLEIELHHRIVMSPFAAKRLAQLLAQLMQEYEARYGPLPEK